MKLGNQLLLERCSHCGVHSPMIHRQHQFETKDHSHRNEKVWGIYSCATCGGVVTAFSEKGSDDVVDYYPKLESTNEAIPERARIYLDQAIGSLHAPAGAVMLCASAVDAMLKAKDYSDGVLNTRILQAADDHLITQEMAAWAHEVRLDANDQRHSGQNADLPSTEDAQKCIDFAKALGEFLFVLPARVARGRRGQN